MQLAHAVVERRAQAFDIRLLAGGDEEAVVAHAGHPRLLQLVERDILAGGRRQVVFFLFHPRVGINLVEHHHLRFVGTAEVFQRGVDHLYLLLEVGMRDVDDMHQQVGLAHLVESRLERVDQVGGQFADEAHCVGQEEGQVLDDHLAHRRVECGEEFVLCEDVALGQEVHDGRLAHIGIAHEGHADESAAVLALCRLLLVDLLQALFEQSDALQDDAAVHLELRLTRSAQTHAALSASAARAAALALKVGPQALQTRQHIAILRQLHLRLGVGRLCAHGEDVEDERRAVQDLHLQLRLDVAYLLGRELIVEDDHAHRLGCFTSIDYIISPLSSLLSPLFFQPFLVGLLALLYIFLDFLQFSLAHIRHLTGAAHALREPLHDDSPGRIGQKLQFVKIFFCLCLVLFFGNQSH